ncbi:MAG: S-layer homology domain-containing protein [Ruminiclostridium sp.]|nr:S-layer homology domain-containing protein [Ruminiclostridium sp.]
MKKRLLSLVMLLVLLCTMVVPAFGAYSPGSIAGTSWYGQYTGWHSSESNLVQRYMNMTIKTCDAYGNITGEAKVTTVAGQGVDMNWVNYQFKGTFDFYTGAFTMQGTKITSQSSNVNWNLAKFQGSLQGDNISGLVDGNSKRVFSFGLVSEWAKDEITDADFYGLIPETLQGKDLSKPVTRAEFSAIAVQLYETLTNQETYAYGSPFYDIYGHIDQKSIEKAYALNITVGVSDTEFAPDSKITREQLATMLCRAIKKYKFEDWTYATDDQYYLDTTGVKKFADDADISDYAKPSVYFMTKMGIIKGIDATHFAPKAVTAEQIAREYATATREQALVMSLRVYNLAEFLQTH